MLFGPNHAASDFVIPYKRETVRPQRYIAIILSGEAEVVTSDGEARRLRPGEVILFDDVTGKGHATRAITDLVVAFVNRGTAQAQ